MGISRLKMPYFGHILACSGTTMIVSDHCIPTGVLPPIRADRDVPPVRAGLWAKNSLKAGLTFLKSSVKTGF